MKKAAEIVQSPGNILGEGPFTFSGNEILWFDIIDSSAYRLTLSDGHMRKTNLDGYLCCAGITADRRIIAAGLNGVMILDECFSIIKTIGLPPFDINEIRFNDGKTGPDGSFWAGAMSCEGDKPVGALYRFRDSISCVIDGMLIPNGLGWSPDGTIMYITDSGKGIISQWDFDVELGVISNERRFVNAEDFKGVPDGLSVDENGNIWSAFWGGGWIIGFSPSGEVIAEICVAAENPTSCCFCGQDYSKLYITSARKGIQTPGPSDGALFIAETGTRGVAPNLFKY